MINILLNLITINYLQFDQNGKHRFECVNKGEEMYLKRGKYLFDLYGGQGGFGYTDGQKSGTGGLGAHVYAECYITSDTPILYYVFVGGAGVGNDKNPGSPNSRSDGGFNGGGKGGIKSPDNAAGGGGGSTDIRLNYNDMTTRQLVASGGSGGTFYPGNPGGALCGLSRDNSPDEYFCSIITNTFGDWDEYCKHPSGIGQDGPDRDDTPCSGGGGGYCGGDADVYSGQVWPMTADSGTSYANNCSTNLDAELCFFNVSIDVGVNEGDGSIIVTKLWECEDENCIFCRDSGDKCERCKNGYLKYNGHCVLNCPEATYQKVDECFDCDEPCYNCSINSSNCISCIENYSLYSNQCFYECPNGTFSMDFECLLCSENCGTCSKAADSCDTCKDNYFYFDNKCYLNCSDLSNEINNDYYGKNNNEKICQKCFDKNCIFCENNFMECQECSSLYYLDNITLQCIHVKTDEFSFSDQFSSSFDFTHSTQFSESNLFSKSLNFTNSDIFSITGDFTESKEFSQSDYFSVSLQFSDSFMFTSSVMFSNSDFFSRSIDFSNSNFFSKTDAFSSTKEFSSSLMFSPSIGFSNSDKFSLTNNFTMSMIFTKTNEFTNSNNFASSNKFTPSVKFSNSLKFTSSQTISFDIISTQENSNSENIWLITYQSTFYLGKVTFSMSYSSTFFGRRSVSFSIIYSNSYSYLLSYIKELNIYTLTVTGSHYQYNLPYIIFFYSPSYTITYIPFQVKSKVLTKEQFIGIVCCSTFVFFSILTVIILVLRRKYIVNSDFDFSIESENLSKVEEENQEDKNYSSDNSYDDDIDFWL